MTLRFAYADPPYIGQAKRHYGPDAEEVDHRALVARLSNYDGWALSLSSPSLPEILSYCPPGVRIGAWVKPFAVFRVGVNPAYCWEPVIFVPGRSGKKRGREVPTVRDFVSANITMRRGVHGAKPDAFNDWLFDLLGMLPGDSLDDLFPGTGGVMASWLKRQPEAVSKLRAAMKEGT